MVASPTECSFYRLVVTQPKAGVKKKTKKCEKQFLFSDCPCLC
ncbi:hypothetical protein CLOM621_08388 [Clostridium sp. M62/1]|nr:hypothetical protein CLOM621_08388 [Clostridium sp. M62/1]